MGRTYNLLFVTFVLNRRQRDLDVRCCGCRNITAVARRESPYLKGTIEFQGQMIPVLDPGAWLCGRRTPLTRSTCILIVEHTFQGRQLRTGILLRDMEDVLNVAASSYISRLPEGISFNARFVLDMPRSASANKFLADSHEALDPCEQTKPADESANAIKRFCSRRLIPA